METISTNLNDLSKKYHKPFLEWRTASLFGISVLGSIASIYYYKTWIIHLPLIKRILFTSLMVLLNSIMSYLQFTVIHEAIHDNISNNRMVNNFFGFIASPWLGPLAQWKAIKLLHLEHHRYTNDKTKDPDMWASHDSWGGPKLILLRWMTIDLYYYKIYVQYIIKNRAYNHLLEYGVQCGLVYLVCGYFITHGFIQEAILFWFISSRLALIFLAFAFDFLPHHPHIITKAVDRYKTTFYLSTPRVFRKIITHIMMYHNYHIIHHLNPTVPYYKYGEYWDKYGNDLVKEYDVPMRNIFDLSSQ